MKPLALDALPAHSEWARYLLDPAGDPPEDPGAYTDPATYDRLYAHLLDDYRDDPVDADRFVRRVFETKRPDLGAVSVDQSLYLASPAELLDLDREAVVGEVRDAVDSIDGDPETVVDLGCGYGAYLGTIADAVPDAAVVGGEYSDHGAALARKLHADRDRVSAERFDFRGDWRVLDGRRDVLVVTRGALTTLSDVASAVEKFADCASAGTVLGGVHLEQVDRHPETTLGLLRRRYARVRGYSCEFVDALEARDDVRVTSVDYDVVGANPLHPLTAVRWRAA